MKRDITDALGAGEPALDGSNDLRNEMPQRHDLKQKLGGVARLVLSIALVGALMYFIGSANILTRIEAVRWQTLTLVTLILASSFLFVTLRWTAILSALGHRVESTALFGSVFIGFQLNQLLPTGVGGDVLRAWRARQLGVPTDVAIHSVLIDRAAGVLVALVGAVSLLPFVDGRTQYETLAWIIGIVAVAGLACCAAAWGISCLPGRPIPWFGQVQRRLTELSSSVAAVATSPRAAFFVFVLACANQLLPVIAIWLLASELHLSLAPLDVGMITLVSTLAAVIPVSVGGWGVREGALVYLFGLYGVAPDAAFAVSMLYGASLTFIAVPGLLMVSIGHVARSFSRERRST
jgi:uncharacterized membrane protein YbhN (UPF0104 family)